ncbi:MAG: hypothetical protein AAGI38_04265, partial [Bacteroidota bacterium]
LICVSILNVNDTSEKLTFQDPASYKVQFRYSVPLILDNIHPYVNDSSYFCFQIENLDKGECPECVDRLNIRYVRLVAYLTEEINTFRALSRQEIIDSLIRKDDYCSFPYEVIADFYKSGFSEKAKFKFAYNAHLRFRMLRR